MTLSSDLLASSPSVSFENGRSTIESPKFSDLNSSTTPSQVLAMTIKKKRKIVRRKDRDLRLEVLLTSTIRHLCQEIGDQLRERRAAGMKRKGTKTMELGGDTVPSVSKRAAGYEDETVKKQEVGLETPLVSPGSSYAPVGSLDQNMEDQTCVSSNDQSRVDNSVSGDHLRKRKRKNISGDDSKEKRIRADDFDEKDPFGLDDFFRSLRTCRVGGSKG